MATTTPRLSLRKPEDTSPDDPVNVVSDLDDNFDKIDSAVGFESVSSFPVSPFLGKGVIRSDLNNRAFVWNGTSWQEVVVIGGMTTPEAEDATTVTTLSTSFVTLAPEVNQTFIAPPSGRVFVTITGRFANSGGSTTRLSWEIRNTNVGGSIITGGAAAEDKKSLTNGGTVKFQASNRAKSPALTPGNTYFIRLMHSVSAGTGTYDYRYLLVEPVVTP